MLTILLLATRPRGGVFSSSEHFTGIFGSGLNLSPYEKFDEAKLEQIRTGASLFGGAGQAE